MSKYKKEELEDLILTQCLSYEAIGRMYGVTGNAIRKAASRLGINLPQKRTISSSEHFNRKTDSPRVCLNCGKELDYSAKKYCSQSCQTEFQYKNYIERWKKGEESGTVGKYEISAHIRRYLFEKYNCSCQICGWNEINPVSGKVPLQIHHIDGDCLNNKEENLQLLCPNHHALTETYGNLNKESSRVYRKQKENL